MSPCVCFLSNYIIQGFRSLVFYFRACLHNLFYTRHIGSGITFGTVFGTSTLTTLGAGVGKAVGQISGSVLGDYLGSSIVGEEYTLKDKLGDLVSGELPGLILDFVRWGTNG